MTTVDTWQALVHSEAKRRWPHITVETEGLALAEEAGEVCRAILKRQEGTRGSADEWTAQLRVEVGQAMLVLLNIAAMEGIAASELLGAAWEGFREKPERETMTGEPVDAPIPWLPGHLCPWCGCLPGPVTTDPRCGGNCSCHRLAP